MSNTLIFTKTLGTVEQVQINRYGDRTLEFKQLLTTSGVITSGGSVISGMGSVNGVQIGNPISDNVSGALIPAGATVTSVGSSSVSMAPSVASAASSGASVTINKTVGGEAPHARQCVPSGILGGFVEKLYDVISATS